MNKEKGFPAGNGDIPSSAIEEMVIPPLLTLRGEMAFKP